jgi:phosphoglycolate phosphatase
VIRASFDLVAFDLDGTLVDSAPDLNHCLGIALAGIGRAPPTLADTRSWIGGGIELLVRRAVEQTGTCVQHEYADALARFHDCYRDHLYSASRTYDGIERALEAACLAGISLCCITNKRHAYAIELLERAGLSAYFEFVYGGDSFPEKKPHPRPLIEAARRAHTTPARCALVGDSREDWRAANAAGFEFVWAAYGYCVSLGTETETLGTARIDRCDDLFAALGLGC